jgi:hypothetical protein
MAFGSLQTTRLWGNRFQLTSVSSDQAFLNLTRGTIRSQKVTMPVRFSHGLERASSCHIGSGLACQGFQKPLPLRGIN